MGYSYSKSIPAVGTTQVTVSLAYLSSAHLTFYVDAVKVTPTLSGSTPLVATFSPAFSGTQQLLIVRRTPRAELPSVFSQNAMFSEAAVDENYKYLLYAVQEDSEVVEYDPSGALTSLAAVGGAGLVGHSSAVTYSAGTVGASLAALDSAIDGITDKVVVGASGVTNIKYGTTGVLEVTPGNPATGPGGNAYDGGILTHKPSGAYQVSAYQIAPTTHASKPEWGPVSEVVLQGTTDQSSDFKRISFTAMAPWAGPSLNDAAGDYRLQQEAGGAYTPTDFKFTSQYNTTGWLIEHLNLRGDGNVQLFRRTDAPATTADNLALILGQLKRTTAPVLTAPGTQDSPKLHLFGCAYDTALHTANWRQHVKVTSNAAASKYLLQATVDGNAWATKLSVTDTGVVSDFTALQFPAASGVSGTVDSTTLQHSVRGVFTPVLAFGGASTGITYSTAFGRFERVGNRVFYEVRVALTSKGSATGSATITGLPYPTINYTGMVWAATFAGNNYAASLNATIATLPAGVSHIVLQKFAAGATTSLTDADFTNSSTINITGHYEVA